MKQDDKDYKDDFVKITIKDDIDSFLLLQTEGLELHSRVFSS